MKNTIYKISLGALVLLSACKKGDDLYTSPNSPAAVTPAVALTALEVNTFMNTEGDLARVSSILVQQMAGATAQYGALQNYNLLENDYNNQWAGLYSGAMYNAKLMIDQYSTTNPYYAGIAKVMMAINLGVATDLWGDVPYSDALKGGEFVFVSKYDTQQQVLTSIQSLLDAAIADFAKPKTANVTTPTVDDLMYGGDVAKWTAAAWTIKARYANRLSLKDAAGSANNVLTYLAKGIKANADNLENIHSEDANALNQWPAFELQRSRNMVANKKFVDALQNDPRLQYYFLPVSGTTNYVGADITQTQINPDASIIGPYFGLVDEDEGTIVAKNYPLVTFFEAKFLEAEAKSRLGQDASSALNDAIKASVTYVTEGTSTGNAQATFTPVTATKTAILTEKWKAMFGHMEAYNDWRRTGIPALTPRPGSAGAIRSYIPQRLPTPQTERQNNPNATVVSLDKPVWFATQ